MDKYDPQKKLALAVDEWGAWYAPAPGTNPGFLVQQNSLRDAVLAALNLNIFARHADRVRMANIAQMVNVLQAMILTDKQRMLLTPTYHVFRMYVPFQDATFIPVKIDAGTWTQGAITLPRVDAIAAKDASGRLLLAVTNVDPARSASINVAIAGASMRSATGETLTALARRQHQHLRRARCRRAEAVGGSVERGPAAGGAAAEIRQRDHLVAMRSDSG